MKKAFITGVTGQDGSYLAELLLHKGYEVHSIVRRSSVFTTDRIDKILTTKNFFSHHGDLVDSSNLGSLINSIEPDEIYNLGAQSHVAVSFEVPEYTAEVDSLGTIRLLNLVKESKKNIKLSELKLSDLTKVESKITENIFQILSPENSVESRDSFGGTASREIKRQIRFWKRRLNA